MEYWENLSLKDLEEELWLDVEGHVGYYKVSNLGRVKRLRQETNTVLSFGRKREGPVDEIMLKQAINRCGYPVVQLRLDGVFTHRLVAVAFVSKIPSGKHQVNHIDGCKRNNKFNNLEWVLPKENLIHAVKNGLIKSGEKNVRAALTAEQVLIIRNSYTGAYGELAKLAKQFKTCSTTIHKVVNGISYKSYNNGEVIKINTDKINSTRRTKLSDIEIKEVRESKFSAKELSVVYGVSVRTIFVIRNGLRGYVVN